MKLDVTLALWFIQVAMTAIQELLWEILSLKNSDVTNDVTGVEGVCDKEEEREYTEVGVIWFSVHSKDQD